MSNFIFSRRDLQESIDRLAEVVKRYQLETIIDRLNDPRRDRLSAMWELVFLDALASVGKLRHEIKLPNGNQPDFELNVSRSNEKPILIIGDVTCISDSGLDAQNPVEILDKELDRLAIKNQLDPYHFGYNIDGRHKGSYQSRKIKLTLPSKGQLLSVMQNHVAKWIRTLSVSPNRPDQYTYQSKEGENFSITYNPNQKHYMRGHSSYTVAASLSKNPLYTALKGKIEQLRMAPEEAIRLVIVCDGGCSLLSQSKIMYSPGNLSPTQVAEDFLRQNSSIDAVLLATVIEEWSVLNSRAKRYMDYKIVVAPSAKRSQRMTTEAIHQFESILKEAIKIIPTPNLNAKSAAIRGQHDNFGPDSIGGFKMSDNQISLSARALQRLLAGDISQDDFIEAHGWKDGSNFINTFALMMNSGRMICKVNVETMDNNDDDWLTFHFGDPDPAISPFSIRKKKTD